MNTWFNTLFTLRVAHEYYGTSEICPDFDFVLAERSQRALAGARLLARISGGKLNVLFEADKKDAQIPQHLAGLELLIGLRLRNPYFEYFTEPLPEPFPLYTNDISPNAQDAQRSLSPQACDLAARRITPAETMTERPLTIEIRRLRDNGLVWSKELPNGDGMPVVDLHAWEAGCYMVTKQSGGKSESRSLIVAPDLAETGIWGAVNICVPQGGWTSPPQFFVEFKSRVESLSYYVVAPKNWADFDKLSVSDASSNPEIAFEELHQDWLPEDSLCSALRGSADNQMVLFLSPPAVKRRAAPTKHFQLLCNGNTLIDYLPLPRADMPVARFVVHLSEK